MGKKKDESPYIPIIRSALSDIGKNLEGECKVELYSESRNPKRLKKLKDYSTIYYFNLFIGNEEDIINFYRSFNNRLSKEAEVESSRIKIQKTRSTFSYNVRNGRKLDHIRIDFSQFPNFTYPQIQKEGILEDRLI